MQIRVSSFERKKNLPKTFDLGKISPYLAKFAKADLIWQNISGKNIIFIHAILDIKVWWVTILAMLNIFNWPLMSLHCSFTALKWITLHKKLQYTVLHYTAVERGAQAQVQHYQCSQQGMVLGMGHWHYTTASLIY